MLVNERLKNMNIDLPIPPNPVGFYEPVINIDNILHISGQLPLADGQIQYQGKVGSSISLPEVQKAIELSVLNAVAIAKQSLNGDLDRVVGIPRLRVYLNAVETFSDHAKIANSASQLLLNIFGDLGSHSRSAVGVASLPLNSPVEIELLFAIK